MHSETNTFDEVLSEMFWKFYSQHKIRMFKISTAMYTTSKGKKLNQNKQKPNKLTSRALFMIYPFKILTKIIFLDC